MSRIPVVAAANYKGGAGKSTTAAFLLWCLARRGFRPTGVDADRGASLVEWVAFAEWDVPVVGLAVPTLHRRLWGVVDPQRTGAVVIDTPPLEDEEGIVKSALMVATDIVVTMAPTTMEVHRTRPMWPAIDTVCSLRDDDPPRVWVLLNRTVNQANSTDEIRARLTKQGHRVLARDIPRLERYAQAFGTVPEEIEGGPYEAVTSEIVRMWPSR